MTEKIDDDKFVDIIKKGERLKEPVIKHRGNRDNGVIATVGDDKKSKVAQMIKDLDKEVEERNEDMDVEILVERDEWGRTRFVIREKEKDLEESVGTEFSELTEATFQESRFEEDDNIIRDVCLLSSLSKNNRRYLDKAMSDVTELASGVKVFADHPKKGETVRSVKDVIGAVEHPHLINGKVYGNLRVLSSHKNWVFALAKETPNLVGMSILAKGKVNSERDSEGREQVESVTALASIDLVSSPASTSGMYENLGVKPDGTIGGVRTGNKFDKKSPVCPLTHKVLCPVYSETNVNYENCKLFKGGENCPYSEGGEFYRKSKEEISDDEVVDIIKK